jgi:hypothetical protein
MDPLRALPGVVGPLQVHERQGGRQQADAFRRALQQDGGEPGPGAGERRAGTALQRRAPASRKDDGKAVHVDVLA